MKKLAFFLLVLLVACKQETKIEITEIHFETMGTWGTVKIADSKEQDVKALGFSIDSILLDVNLEFNTYWDSSTISRFNKIDTGKVEVSSEFFKLFYASIDYTQKSSFYFNAKVLPLINYYGFAYEPGVTVIDSSFIDSLVFLVNSDLSFDVDVYPEVNAIFKTRPIQFDFSAFAKGYGVDQVAYYLDSLGIDNYMVEIGGEVHCKGLNADLEPWRLGIEEPNEEIRAIFEIVGIKDKAMATSGNYRNFKVLENGQKIVHIVNPKTGYPEVSNLLSASILADDCMTADAYATACMVMGVDTCFQFVLTHPELECYLIYSDDQGVLQSMYTNGFKELIVE